MTTHRLYLGNVYETIHKIPDNSISFLLTSPPYYLLRSYPIPPILIGGYPNCSHKWNTYTSDADLRFRGEHSNIGKDADPNTTGNVAVEGSVCELCGCYYGQLGHEPTPQMFVNNLCYLFDLIKPKLNDTATMFVNLSDTHSHSGGTGSPKRSTIHTQFGKAQEEGNYQKPHQVKGYPSKTRLCIPERFATAMVDNGWLLRNDLIWVRTNSTPESVNDRFSRKHEHVYFFTKSPHYYFNIEEIKRTITTDTIERYKRAFELGAYSVKGKYTNGELGRPTQPPSWISSLCINKSEHEQKTLFDSEDPPLSDSNSKFKKVSDPETYGSPRARDNGNEDKELIGTGNPWDIIFLNNKGLRDKHYAAYASGLVEYLIRAGCPELVCSKCGAPKRQVHISGGNSAFNIRVRDVKEGRVKHTDRVASNEEVDNYNEEEYVSEAKEHVIAEGCNCDEGFIPATVFDPFVGSGSTMMVAKHMERSSIGCELSEEYAKIIIKRCSFNVFDDFRILR